MSKPSKRNSSRPALGTLVIRKTEYDMPPPDDLELGECMEIKEITGYGVEDFYAAIVRTEGPALAVFAMIVIRRSGKNVTLRDVQTIRLSDFEIRLDDDEEEAEESDPTPAEEAGSKPSASDSPDSETTPAAAGSPPSERYSD